MCSMKMDLVYSDLTSCVSLSSSISFKKVKHKLKMSRLKRCAASDWRVETDVMLPRLGYIYTLHRLHKHDCHPFLFFLLISSHQSDPQSVQQTGLVISNHSKKSSFNMPPSTKNEKNHQNQSKNEKNHRNLSTNEKLSLNVTWYPMGTF